MGSIDGAEICELVGQLILSKLKDKFGNDIVLYRDDGLVVLNMQNPADVMTKLARTNASF